VARRCYTVALTWTIHTTLQRPWRYALSCRHVKCKPRWQLSDSDKVIQLDYGIRLQSIWQEWPSLMVLGGLIYVSCFITENWYTQLGSHLSRVFEYSKSAIPISSYLMAMAIRVRKDGKNKLESGRSVQTPRLELEILFPCTSQTVFIPHHSYRRWLYLGCFPLLLGVITRCTFALILHHFADQWHRLSGDSAEICCILSVSVLRHILDKLQSVLVDLSCWSWPSDVNLWRSGERVLFVRRHPSPRACRT